MILTEEMVEQMDRDISLHVRMNSDLKNKLDMLADQEGMKTSPFVRFVIEKLVNLDRLGQLTIFEILKNYDPQIGEIFFEQLFCTEKEPEEIDKIAIRKFVSFLRSKGVID